MAWRNNEEARRWVESCGLPYTRENYIRLNWGQDFGPGEWTAEHEEELPSGLQDWSRFTDSAEPNPASGSRPRVQ